MKAFLVSLFMLTWAVSSYAVSLEFSFDVNSSGTSMYPCDAGIRHARHTERVCYDRVTQASCTPALCTNLEQCNCVCTGSATTGDGEYRQDFLQAKHTAWTENGTYASSSVQSSTVSALDSGFARIFTNKNEWDKQLTALSFNLGSERYGADFYLDVCYRGPQIEYWQAYQGSTNSDLNYFPNFAIKLQATVTDLVTSNGLNYSTLADLKVKTEVACDVQGLGNYVYAHSGTAATTTPVYDNAQAHDLVSMSSGDKNFATGYAAFNAGSNLFLLNDWINLGNANTPRFCKIRYTFIENVRNNTANPLAQIRKWKNHKARICTYSDISEGAN